MNVQHSKMVNGGRLIVPVAFRHALGLVDGDSLTIELDGDEIRIRSQRAAIARAQAYFKKLAPEDVLLSEELIADRRAEAAGE